MKKKNSTPTPHAATFRQFLTQPDIARDFLALHLPPELRECGDLGTLKLESGSFAEDDLRQYFSDVLYSLKLWLAMDIGMYSSSISYNLTNLWHFCCCAMPWLTCSPTLKLGIRDCRW